MKIITNNHDRYTGYHIAADERPRRMYEYWVTGRGEFPYDMLRYDAAWPATGEDAAKIAWSFGEANPQNSYERSIKFRSYREPTIGRWSSFLWSVSKEEFKFAPRTDLKNMSEEEQAKRSQRAYDNRTEAARVAAADSQPTNYQFHKDR